jgi:hypothetical protein
MDRNAPIQKCGLLARGGARRPSVAAGAKFQGDRAHAGRAAPAPARRIRNPRPRARAGEHKAAIRSGGTTRPEPAVAGVTVRRATFALPEKWRGRERLRLRRSAGPRLEFPYIPVATPGPNHAVSDTCSVPVKSSPTRGKKLRLFTCIVRRGGPPSRLGRSATSTHIRHSQHRGLIVMLVATPEMTEKGAPQSAARLQPPDFTTAVRPSQTCVERLRSPQVIGRRQLANGPA